MNATTHTTARPKSPDEIETRHLGKRQAKAGGEIGANGEWYPGGAFINTVPENPKGAVKKRKLAGRRNIAPGVWEMQPFEGAIAIFPQLAGFEIFNRASNTFTLNPSLRMEWATASAIARREAKITAYNAGQRWEAPQ